MRIAKDGKERLNEILDVAERLFCINGYDETSTNDILNEIGIARGTLYYYFRSKEEILDAIVERLMSSLLIKSKHIAKDTKRDVIDRMVDSIANLNIDTKLGETVVEVVHKPHNALLKQKMRETLLTGICPIITDLVVEGIEKGEFNTEYPTEAIDMIMMYAYDTFDPYNFATGEKSAQLREIKIKGLIYNLERLLGVEAGTLSKIVTLF